MALMRELKLCKRRVKLGGRIRYYWQTHTVTHLFTPYERCEKGRCLRSNTPRYFSTQWSPGRAVIDCDSRA